MKYVVTLVVGAILGAIVGALWIGPERVGEPSVQEAAGLSEEDVAAMRSHVQAYAEAARAGDWAGVAALYTEDVVWMPQAEPAVEGRAAYEAWSAELPPLRGFSLGITEIDGCGDLAYVRGTSPSEGAPEPIQRSSKYIQIHRRQPDGTWLIAVDIFNTDQPPREAGAEN